MQRVLTSVTLLGLLVATAAAFVITEHLKLIKSPVYGTQVSKVFSPVCHCATSKATVRIRLRHSDRVTVTIVDSGHHQVATIASNESEPRKTPRVFAWYGHTASGALAPDGVYYPWVHLANARWTGKFLNRIVLDTKAPEVLSAHRAKPVLFAGPGRSIAIRYTFSEPAHAIVYLGGQVLVVGRATRPTDKIKWAGTLGGRPVGDGRYVLSIGARDVAGNETPASARKRVTVVVRHLEVLPQHVTVKAGGRLTVSVRTAVAQRYTWRLGHRHGTKSAKLLHVRAPTTPGTYRLVVSAEGSSATAVVRVRAK